MMMKHPIATTAKAIALYCFFQILASPMSSQTGQEDGYIEFQIVATKQSDQKSLEGAGILVYKGEEQIQNLVTSGKGKASFQLKYGSSYKIVLSKPGFITTFFTINGEVPVKMLDVRANFQQAVVFVDKSERTIDTLKFHHPFTKYAYDAKEKRIKEDDAYLKEFGSGIFKDDEIERIAKAKQEAKERLAREKREAEEKRISDLKAEFRKRLHLAGKLLAADASHKPVTQTKVSLVNASGKVLETVTTNALGSFAFTTLPPDQNFTVQIEDLDPKLAAIGKIELTTKDGKELMSSTPDAKGKFAFKVQATDKKTIEELHVDDATLRTDIRGMMLKSDKGAVPYVGLKINLTDESGKVLQTCATNEKGAFLFKNLPAAASYRFSVDENEPQLMGGQKLYVANSKGKVLTEVSNPRTGWFYFEVISAEKNGLTEIYEDDPWLSVVDPERIQASGGGSMVIKEKVFFKSNDAVLLEDAKHTLDEVIYVMQNLQDINIELSSHTDSKGSDEYNMKLSEKRAKSAVDYIVAHGIDKSRITGKGYGESQLLNKCKNGVECTEEEHAQNRRLEFRVIHK